MEYIIEEALYVLLYDLFIAPGKNYACGKNLVGLWLEGQKYYQGTLKEALIEKDAVPLFDIAKKWLDRYFSGQKPDVAELPLAPQGNAFRQGVWEILCTIPYGEVITYGSIAKKWQ